jgi:hypothetical protein
MRKILCITHQTYKKCLSNIINRHLNLSAHNNLLAHTSNMLICINIAVFRQDKWTANIGLSAFFMSLEMIRWIQKNLKYTIQVQ